MRLLILGGTRFLGRAVARHALTAGHDVTCAARGRSGSAPPGATFVPVDRDAGLAAWDGGHFDAVVDVTSRPSHARDALAALADRVEHWTFVSTCNVYADQATPGQRATTAPLVEPAPPEADDPTAGADAYGACKVACERAVLSAMGPDRAFVCRAGLIVGPEDGSGRFGYWVRRLARGGQVLAPGRPEDAVQWVDVRDLAAWIVRAAEVRLSGAYDGIGPPVTRAEFLAGVAAGVGTDPVLTWVDQEFLAAREVKPWNGPRSLPMWLPLPEYAGFMSRDVSASVAAGLVTRNIAETARDTHAWFAERAEAPVDDADRPGLTAAEEAALLADYAGRTGGFGDP